MFASRRTVYLRRRLGALALLAAIAASALLLAPSSSSGARPPQIHVVRPGETLWAIAAASGRGDDTRAEVDAIEQRNSLQTTVIVPGERLVVP